MWWSYEYASVFIREVNVLSSNEMRTMDILHKKERNVNSDFLIVTMGRVAIISFELSCKKFYSKHLVARHFMIISLFKICA